MAEYISRETMIKLLQRMADYAEANGFYYDREVIEFVAATLAGIPAADVAQVVHGKWLNIDGDYTFAACSICSEEYEVATEEEAEKGLWSAYLSAYRYCPNCGAKMDEVDSK